MSQQRRAFTLIELLIVVAIIAILAAIAVPNFLEAQTRAKVTTGKANIRVMLGALDVYRLDWNHFPPAGPHGVDDPYGILADQQLRVLTTPLAYLSTNAFRDPFGQVRGQALTAPPAPSLFGDDKSDFPVPRLPNANKSLLYYHYPSFAAQTANPAVSYNGVGVISLGPDAQDSFGAFRPFDKTVLPPLARAIGFTAPVDTQYDPTNGTVSRGDLFGFTGDLAIERLP